MTTPTFRGDAAPLPPKGAHAAKGHEGAPSWPSAALRAA
jgi:hypothetical protein